MAFTMHLVLATSVLLCLQLCSSQDDEMSITGVVDDSVTLKCDLPTSDPAKVTWRDRVYNVDRNPIQIFTSESNPNMAVNGDHMNKAHFTVNEDYSLTINTLKEDDVGMYFCESETDEGLKKKIYNLNIASKADCEGVVDLTDGDTTTLTCTAKVVGNQLNPKMEWYAGDEKIDSDDKSDIGMVKTIAQVEGTWDKDKVVYTCRLLVGDLVEECPLTLSVKYAVRDLTVTPNKDKYRVGDKLKCSAMGNPTPVVSWVAAQGATVTSVEGASTLTIPKEWEGKATALKCKASNSFGGVIVEQVSEDLSVTPAETQGKVEPAEAEKPEEAKAAGSNQVAGIVAGLIIGAVVLVIIVIAVVCIRRKQRKKPKDEKKGAKPVPTKEDDLKRDSNHHADGKGGNCAPVELTKFKPRTEVHQESEVEPLKDPYGDYNKKTSNDDTLPIRGMADDDVITLNDVTANGINNVGDDNNANSEKPTELVNTDDLDALLRDLENSVP